MRKQYKKMEYKSPVGKPESVIARAIEWGYHGLFHSPEKLDFNHIYKYLPHDPKEKMGAMTAVHMVANFYSLKIAEMEAEHKKEVEHASA